MLGVPEWREIFEQRAQNAEQELAPALRAASIVWDDRMLRAFLRNPAGFVPGNRMVSPGVRDAARLEDLLFYLRHVTEPGAREP